MQKALPTFDNIVINAEVFFDSDSNYLKATITSDSGEESTVNIIPGRLLDIYSSSFVRYMKFGVKCSALLVRGENPDYIEEAPDEYPQYLYKVVSYNDTQAETQYQAIIARQEGESEGYDLGYEEGYKIGLLKGKYYGAKQLGDYLKEYTAYVDNITVDVLTTEVNNIISELYDNVIDEYPKAFVED